MNRRLLTAAAAAAASLVPLASTAGRPATAAPVLSFTTPQKLLGAAGGEPSVVSDGRGDVYVTGPQKIPAIGSGTPGVGVWASHDDGHTFAFTGIFGSYAGGGDSDVQIQKDGTVYIADLEAVGSALCYSKDGARTFTSIGPAPDPNGCGGVVAGQAGPSSDRQWLTADQQGHLYLSYHEFVSAQPVIFRSDTNGNDLFTAGPCGPMITDPTIEANVPQDVTGGTLMVKPVADRDGTIYAMFTTSTQSQNVSNLPGHISGTFSQIYLAISHDNCASWQDVTVYDGSNLGTNTVQFGDDFNDMAIDGAGNLYAISAGYVTKDQTNAPIARLYMLMSRDHGQTWTAPKEISTRPGAYMMPSAIGGPAGGQLAVGVYHTINGVTDPNDPNGKWTYEALETSDAFGQLNAPAGATTASLGDLVDVPVNAGSTGRGFVYHAHDICNSGTLCGLGLPGTGNDRTLADFTMAALGADGCPIFAFAANPGDPSYANTFNYVTRQTSGCFATAAASSPAPGGAQPVTQPTQAPGSGVLGLANTSAAPGAAGAAGAAAVLGGLAALVVARRRRSAA